MNILYRHIRTDKNEPFYIGIGSNIKRAYSKSGRSIFWERIVAKTDYEVEILLESDDYEFIKQKEIEFIALYGRRDLGKGTLVNLTDGGEGMLGNLPTIKTREKLSKARFGFKHTEETKDKISNSLKYNNRSDRGLKISSSLKEFHKSNKKFQTQETKNKISNSMMGKKHSIESKEKMKNSKGIKILCTKTGLKWSSITKCAKDNNLNYNTLKNKLNGSRNNFCAYKLIVGDGLEPATNLSAQKL